MLRKRITPSEQEFLARRRVKTLVPSPDDLLTTAQTSEITRFSTITLAIWRCRKDPRLPWVKIGSRCFYRRGDVVAFIRRHRVKLPKQSAA